MENNGNKFEFTYTAPTERERREVGSLRKQYLPEEKNTDKLARLRKLDEKVKTPPQILALTLGVVGTLIFGLGLTMILEWSLIAWGAIVAVIGIVPLALAYPIYRWLFKKLQDKHREEILRLSEEILNEEK